jgi:hypothetical protein
MTPIVFCASLVPCASETSEALPIWPMRKVRSSPRPARFPTIRNGSHRPREDRRHEGREDHLADDAVELGSVARPVHAVHAEARERGSDEAAEQRVRRARREAEQPGEEVPDDAADEAGQHDEQQRGSAALEQRRVGRARLVLDLHDRVRDRERHLDAEEGAHQVEHGGERDRDLGLQRAGRDGRGHRVRRVVEAVGEVEGERRDDDEHEENEGIHGDELAPCSAVPSTGDRRVHPLFTPGCGESGGRATTPAGPRGPT